MQIIILLVVVALATTAKAKVPRIVSPESCIYVGVMRIVSLSPREFAPAFGRVSRQTFEAMKKLERKSLALAKYDKIWKGTDWATEHMRYFLVLGAPCGRYESTQKARAMLTKGLYFVWNTYRKRKSYHGICCWPRARVWQ